MRYSPKGDYKQIACNFYKNYYFVPSWSLSPLDYIPLDYI